MNVIYLQDGIISIADEIRVLRFEPNGNDIATIWWNGSVYLNGGRRAQPTVYFVCLFVSSHILSHE